MYMQHTLPSLLVKLDIKTPIFQHIQVPPEESSFSSDDVQNDLPPSSSFLESILVSPATLSASCTLTIAAVTAIVITGLVYSGCEDDKKFDSVNCNHSRTALIVEGLLCVFFVYLTCFLFCRPRQ